MTTMDEKVAMFDLLKSQFSNQLEKSQSCNLEKLEEKEHNVESNASDSLMSSVHKQILKDNLTILVENMVPDDMFNILISKDTLTSMDVRRIRAGTTWETINTELIGHIMRKSDLAFTTLVESLKLTCQGHLADLLELGETKEDKNKSLVEHVMSAKKKQLINKQRPLLVSDMTPDEIYNEFVSQKILTLSEISRLKEKSRESANEELLDYIVRRSDRAFQVLVESLKKTQQDHLSKLLELPVDSLSLEPVPKKLKVEVEEEKEENSQLNVEAEKEHVCTLEDVQNQIVLMAESAFGNIRRKDDSRESFDQFCSEMAQTTTNINNSLELIHALRAFCEQSTANTGEECSSSGSSSRLTNT